MKWAPVLKLEGQAIITQTLDPISPNVLVSTSFDSIANFHNNTDDYIFSYFYW